MMGLRHTPTSIQGLTLLCAALVALPASARPEERATPIPPLQPAVWQPGAEPAAVMQVTATRLRPAPGRPASVGPSSGASSGTTSGTVAGPSGAAPQASRAGPATASPPSTAVQPLTQGAVQVGSPIRLTVGKSTLLRLPESAQRLSIANPDVADVMLVNPTEVYVLAKKGGTTNLMVWTAGGITTVRDLQVGTDVEALRHQIQTLVPQVAACAWTRCRTCWWSAAVCPMLSRLTASCACVRPSAADARW